MKERRRKKNEHHIETNGKEGKGENKNKERKMVE